MFSLHKIVEKPNVPDYWFFFLLCVCVKDIFLTPLTLVAEGGSRDPQVVNVERAPNLLHGLQIELFRYLSPYTKL